VASDDRLGEFEVKYEGYKVYDRDGEELGTVGGIFAGETGRAEYIGVKMGFFELRSTLIPIEVVSINERERTVEVADSRESVEDAPTHDDDEEITPGFKSVLRRYFSLETVEPPAERGSHGQHTGSIGKPDPDTTSSEDDTLRRDHTEAARPAARPAALPGEPVGQEEYRDREDDRRARTTGRGDPGAGSAGTNREEAGYQEAEGRVRGDVGERSGGYVGGPEDKEFEDMRDYQSATTGSPLERQGGPGEPVTGVPRVEDTDRRGSSEDGERGGSTSYSSESTEFHGGGETQETFERPTSEVPGMRGEEGGRVKVTRRIRRAASNESTREESEYRSDW